MSMSSAAQGSVASGQSRPWWMTTLAIICVIALLINGPLIVARVAD
jgi:hypothetical protein